jgi:uncharacterized protein (TIGR02284 family)
MAEANGGEVLNALLQSAYDSVDGFRQGASLARNPEFQSLFRERAEEREQLAERIAAEVRAFGVDPANLGTIAGEAHQLFTYARNAVARGSDKGLVEELVRREDLVTQRFQAVADDGLSPEPARKIAADALATLAPQRDELETLSRQFHPPS